MASFAFGEIGEFDTTQEHWENYHERLEFFFVTNGITSTDVDETKKRAIFLCVIGSKAYAIVRNLTAPVKPVDVSYAELIRTVKNHFQPPPSPIIMRFKFNTRFRKSDESVAEYVAQLCQLSEHCEFGDSLSDMLRDRFVVGINKDIIQQRLLSDTSLTFNKALEIAQGLETAEKNAHDLKIQSDSYVNKMHGNKRQGEICQTGKRC